MPISTEREIGVSNYRAVSIHMFMYKLTPVRAPDPEIVVLLWFGNSSTLSAPSTLCAWLGSLTNEGPGILAELVHLLIQQT